MDYTTALTRHTPILAIDASASTTAESLNIVWTHWVYALTMSSSSITDNGTTELRMTYGNATTLEATWTTWVQAGEATATAIRYAEPYMRNQLVPEPMTPEMAEQARLRQAEFERERQARGQEREHLRELAAQAESRGEALLMEFLEPMQWQMYKERGYVDVVTPKGLHVRLHKGGHTGVQLRRDIHGNKQEANFCVYTPKEVPDADDLLNKLLHLRHDEDSLWRVANGRRELAGISR